MRHRTPKQSAASRLNGTHSHGPATPEGKHQSAQNSRKHGLFAKAILLPGESRAEFDRLANQLHDRFQPADFLEAMLVQRMVIAQWRLIRVWAFEQAGMLQEQPPDPSHTTAADPITRDLAAFHNLHGRARSSSVLQLSELRYQRQFDRAIAQLERLRAAQKLEIEGTNLVTPSFPYVTSQSNQPKAVPRRPARVRKPSQTDPRPSQTEPADTEVV